jgi:diguanylate cyclase (GGDEF)-like protein
VSRERIGRAARGERRQGRMREIMATFLGGQLDFIYFLYGLAFMLLGAVCLGGSGGGARDEGWTALGLFGYSHGSLEWMELFALVVGDDPYFAFLRFLLLNVSFLFLLEFARLEWARLGQRGDPAIYAALMFPVALVALWSGLPAASPVTRYLIAFTSASAAACALARRAQNLSGDGRRFLMFAAIGFALYAIAAGLVVRPAPFWPANELNAQSFVAATGTPIQLWRGLLGCWIAFSVWSIRQNQLALELASRRYTNYLRKQFGWTIAALAAILLGGWTLTNYLGKIYDHNVVAEARGDLALLASRLGSETDALDAMARTLAGTPAVQAAMQRNDPSSGEEATSALDLHVDASGAELGMIMNRSGAVVAAAGRRAGAAEARDYAERNSFIEALNGASARCFVFDRARGAIEYAAGEPIRNAAGDVVGVAQLVRTLADVEIDLIGFERAYYLVDPDGVVAMTNHPEDLLRPMWPLSATQAEDAERRFGALRGRPMLKREFVDDVWAVVDDEREYLRRSFARGGGWSLVLATPTRELFASRVLGIIVTLLVTTMTLIYLVGKERRLHDGIQMDKRLHLQELARDLGQQAVTDPLTGLFNRLRVDQALAGEVARASRYGDPLSLVLFDVDFFKAINDAHGHQAGDRALVRLADAARALVRRSDLLARWGGEEFILLTPDSDGASARNAAEKLRAAIERLAFEDIGKITCSFGVTQYVDGDTAETLVRRADRALYLAKLNGRNRVEAVSASDASTDD